jgi:hypothetical protein
MTPRAMAFRAAIDQRYRRTALFRAVPVTAVLRAMPRPVRVQNRVHIDARTQRLVLRGEQPGVAASRRVESRADPVISRLVDRAQRTDGARDIGDPAVQRAALVPASRRPAPAAAVPFVAPVAMVLARAQAGPPPGVPAAATIATGDWPGESTAHSRPAMRRSAEPETAPPHVDVRQLTDRVVAAIDRRMNAARERFGA